MEQGIWGIELDIRWTIDLHPVVIHDSDCRRVFAEAIDVEQVALKELQSAVPEIPSLEQIIQRYGKKIHLMIEIKKVRFFDPPLQKARLKTIFSSLEAGTDFHILALDTNLFQLVDFLPNSALLPIAEFNIRQFSETALQYNYAGVCGQYLVISKARILNHQRFNQKTGTGFARSRFCFYRELNRGVEWIFTNHASRLRKIQQQLLEAP